MEATQESIDEWIDKQNIFCPYNGILFSLKKEGNSDTWYNMVESGGHYTKWKKTVTRRQILYDSTYRGYQELSSS